MIHESMMIKSTAHKEPKAVRFLTDATLCRMYQAGNRMAGDKILRRHIAFCHLVANKFSKVPVPQEDLFQAILMGMEHAAKLYQANKDVLFTSYAIWWMKAHATRYIDENCHTIRLPSNKQQALSRAFASLSKGRPFAKDEAEAMDAYLSTSCVSLEAKPGNSQVTYAEMIPGDDGRDNIEGVDTGLLRRYVADLSPKESKVIRLLFGLDTGTKMTLREVGDILGVTHERARQIKESALKSLRGSMVASDWGKG